MRRAFSCLIVVLAAVDSIASSGASLTVRVHDPQGAPAPRAEVRAVSRDGRLRYTCATDDAGACTLGALAAGEYLLTAEGAGLAPSRPAALSLEAGETRETAVRLGSADFAERIVVTAAGTLQTGEETSKAVGTIDAGEIDARDEVWIADALRTAPGLLVQQLGGPGAFTTIKARGLRNEDTAVLIDGVPFRDAAAPQGDASGFIGEMPLPDVDRIEVLRGSGSSLHGSHAIGGAVNVITRRGGGAPRGAVRAEAGTLGLTRGRAHLAGGLDGDVVTYSAGATQVDVSKGLDGDDAARQTALQGRVDLRLPGAARLGARIFAVSARSAINEGPDAIGTLPAGVIEARPLSLSELRRYETGAAPESLAAGDANFIPSANDPDSERDSSWVSAGLVWEQRPFERVGYTISYQHVTTTRAFTDGPLGVTPFEPAGRTLSEYDGTLQTLGARADVSWGARHLTTALYEFVRERFESRALPVAPDPASSVAVTQGSHTLFLQHQVRPAERLTASAAGRAQFFSLEAPSFVPAERAPYQLSAFSAPPAAYTADLSAAYLVGTRTKLRAHAGNGYRAPSLYERFGTFFSRFGYSVYGDPRLGPERSFAADAGLDHELGRHLRLSATAFFTRLPRVIAYESFDAETRAADPYGRRGGYRNAEGRPARGLELSLSTRLGGFTAAASYTYSDAEPRRGQPAEIDQAFGVPRHIAAAVLTFRIGAWQIAADATASSSHLGRIYDSTTFASRAYRFDGGVDVDLVASYTMRAGSRGRVRFFGKVDNALGGIRYEGGFRTPGRLLYGGAAFEL